MTTDTQPTKRMRKPKMSAGDKTCYVYFDTEFTGLRKNTSLISIGLVTSEGDTFYAEFTDYNAKQIDPWIQENVMNNLLNPITVLEGRHWAIKGTRTVVREQLWNWLAPFKEQGKLIQFASDVSHYDFVLLIDLLLGDPDLTAIDLPVGISPCCLDINQDIATSIQRQRPVDVSEEEFNKNFIPVYTAFNFDREELLEGIPSFNYEGNKHNSLYDALVIRAIHQHLWGISNE